MSDHFLGVVGTPDFSNYNRTAYTGVATNQDVNTLNRLVPPSLGVLNYPSTAGGFGGGATLSLKSSMFPYVLWGSDSSTVYGCYKLTFNDPATIRFDIWGGGGYATANAWCAGGGYTTYTASFTSGDEIGLYVAGTSFALPPTSAAIGKQGGWPDGGHGGTGASYHGYGGAGSSRVGLFYSSVAAANATTATYYAIAGGAGGMHLYDTGPGAGGGTTGATAAVGNYSAGGGGGGTQTAGGAGGVASSYGGTGLPGSKYQGGNGVAYSSYGGGAGGGGGYYGGGAGGTVYASGGGGSGYINTSFSGYVSGATTQGGAPSVNGGLSPAGSYSNKPTAGTTGAGDRNSMGAIVMTKV